MDPGNFATNIRAGSRYGYDLLWVVVLANLLGMLFQALSAKLGLVTGRNLAELCRDRLPAPLVWTMWVVSEIAAMATDLAEFVGGAIGLSLLLNLPLLSGMAATAVIVYALLSLQRFGFRPIELAIGGLVAAIGISYLVEVLIAPIDWAEAARQQRAAAASQQPGTLDCGRDYRRDHYAACALLAFRADTDAHPAAD